MHWLLIKIIVWQDSCDKHPAYCKGLNANEWYIFVKEMWCYVLKLQKKKQENKQQQQQQQQQQMVNK